MHILLLLVDLLSACTNFLKHAVSSFKIKIFYWFLFKFPDRVHYWMSFTSRQTSNRIPLSVNRDRTDGRCTSKSLDSLLSSQLSQFCSHFLWKYWSNWNQQIYHTFYVSTKMIQIEFMKRTFCHLRIMSGYHWGMLSTIMKLYVYMQKM